MYGDILLIKEKKEKEYTVKQNRVEIKTLKDIKKLIEGKANEKK